MKRIFKNKETRQTMDVVLHKPIFKQGIFDLLIKSGLILQDQWQIEFIL